VQADIMDTPHSHLSDPIKLALSLIQCPSVTPVEGGALTFLEGVLKDLGFRCQRLRFESKGTEPVDNLFAKLGTTKPHFCFAGHTDVVPPGDLNAWMNDPFQGVLRDGVLYGRGAVDMKGAIAAFVAAVSRILHKHPLPFSVSLLITGDEEGVAINGTRRVLGWLEEHGESIDFCLVGEPTCQEKLGDTIKIGRRGSLNTHLTVKGRQGHVAYPERARNPVSHLIDILYHLKKGPPESKSQYFSRSNLEITSIDVGNQTTNLIPDQASARFNIRFNDQHTGASLERWISQICKEYDSEFQVKFELCGEAEFIAPNLYTHLLAQTIAEVTGVQPKLKTLGGTSDARFIRHYAPVLEFGLVGRTMHQVDECVEIRDLERLTEIYQQILLRWPTIVEQ
jgi:succinyl-diaminopimelate desuccinylase